MAAPTDQELKDAAKEALMKILSSGQSYTIGSRKLNRPDFEKVAEYLAATSGGDDPSGEGSIQKWQGCEKQRKNSFRLLNKNCFLIKTLFGYIISLFKKCRQLIWWA